MVNLLELRKSFGISQTVMATKFGVCLRTYQNWEYGKSKLPGPAIKIYENLKERYIHPEKSPE